MTVALPQASPEAPVDLVEVQSAELLKEAQRVIEETPLPSQIWPSTIQHLNEIEQHVQEVHGPVPSTPTWEDIVSAATETQDSPAE